MAAKKRTSTRRPDYDAYQPDMIEGTWKDLNACEVINMNAREAKFLSLNPAPATIKKYIQMTGREISAAVEEGRGQTIVFVPENAHHAVSEHFKNLGYDVVCCPDGIHTDACISILWRSKARKFLGDG